MKNKKLNQWEQKQILDIASKGVNSILMNSTNVEVEKLWKTFINLIQMYRYGLALLQDDLSEEERKKNDSEIIKIEAEIEEKFKKGELF